MTHDIENVQPILILANTSLDGELAFTYPEIIEAIHLCTANEIAVLGVEMFLVRDGGYYASGSSTYDLQMNKWDEAAPEQWGQCVAENNMLAEESIRRNPAGDDHVYLLTTASWREFCVIQKMKRRGNMPGGNSRKSETA